jgi:hypothetical protein
MGNVLFAVVGNITELATEGPHFCFSVVLLKFVSAKDLGNATINASNSTLINAHIE